MSKNRSRSLTPAKNSEKRQVHSNLLYDGKVLDIIQQFGHLAATSYGPTGRLKFLQTSVGGHVTVTSYCCSIIHHLMGVSHPVLRLIMMAIKGHLELFNDGGLSMAILATRLVETSLNLDVPRAVILKVNSEAQDMVTGYLSSDECPWKMKIDISDMRSMLCLVRTVVGTKPACRLTKDEQELLCTVLIEAFLQSIPTTTKDKEPLKLSPDAVQFLYCEGSPVNETKAIHGVILEAPELPTYSIINTQKLSNLKVALYNVSMAGDTEEWFEGVTQVASGEMKQAEMSEGVVKQMKGMGLTLVHAGVGLVACQKCIHPTLKQFLKEKGVYVIERLSILHIGSVQRLTGAQVLSTFTLDIPFDRFGFLEKIEHLVIANKSYLHLLPSKDPSPCQPVSTVVLCSPDQTSLDELKKVCQSAMTVLHGVLSSPYVVAGGGCLDTHLAWYLRSRARHCSLECLERISTTKAQYMTVMNNVARCLETVAISLEHDGGDHVSDSSNHHHWILPPGSDPTTATISSCVCGLVSRDQCNGEWCIMGSDFDLGGSSQSTSSSSGPMEIAFSNSVIDLYVAKLNALRTVFETVNVLLRVKHLVSDSG